MYPCSEEFHRAVANGNLQKALLIFPDMVFTDDDINVDNGIGFHDRFNLEDDLAIGQTPSNEITFSLFNDERLLNDYGFGEFTATLGVLISEGTYVQRGIVTVQSGGNLYSTQNVTPYLYKNGSAVGSQPGSAPIALLTCGGKLYYFGENGNCTVYRQNDMTVLNETVPAFMTRKARKHWYYKGMDYSDRILREWQGEKATVWEFVPLGVFIAERPKVPNVIEIDFTCYDRMTKFDIDMPSAAELGMTYPATIGTLYDRMCAYVGVPSRTGDFINRNAVIEKEPEDFQSVTMRQVMQWIAEAAGSNARFDRDGYLVLDWLKSTAQAYGEGDYTEFLPYWYQTEQIGKLYNRYTSEGEDTTLGSGGGSYLIQDNPLLKGGG